MEIGDILIIDCERYRVIPDGVTHFALNNLDKGGCLRHYGWKVPYLVSSGMDRLVAYDVRNNQGS